MTKEEAIKLAKDHSEFRNIDYAVVLVREKYVVVTLQSAIINRSKIVFSTKKEA